MKIKYLPRPGEIMYANRALHDNPSTSTRIFFDILVLLGLVIFFIVKANGAFEGKIHCMRQQHCFILFL